MIKKAIPSFFLLIALTICSNAQEKIKILKAEDLPKHTYRLENRNALEIINSKETIQELSAMIKKDIHADLTRYDIRDNSTLRSMYARLRMIATIEGDYASALQYVQKEREYSDKESERIVRAMDAEALLHAVIEKNSLDPEIVNPEIAAMLTEHMNVTDFSIIQEDIEEFKGIQEIYSENLILGSVQGQLQQAIDNNKGSIPGDLVNSLVGSYYMLNFYLPYKDAFYKASAEVLEEYGTRVKKVDIWKERNVTLGERKDQPAVVIGIWDSGVDMDILPENNRWINSKERFDGKDSDGNGFIDDVYGIAYDLKGLKEPEYLYPEAHHLSNIKDYQLYIKGLMDLMANIESKDASALRKHMATLQPEDVDSFLEKLNLYGIYSHGTHVAGIAIEGNPNAAVLVARITFDYRTVPDPYNDKTVEQLANSQREIVEYFKENGVRVVNMSWSESYESIVSVLEMNGIGEDDEERKALGKKYFNTLLNSFTDAINSAPEILFVTSSGNSNDDVDFTGSYPNSLNFPNLITVGAVDIEGKKTSFTTEGESVDVYANGYEVESYVPGGNRIPLSGTSMATPQLVNLAGKLLVINPDLSPSELKEIIIKSSTVSAEDEDVLLIHPAEAMKRVIK